MSRYFIEVAYKGTNYSGFQIQENAPTVQSEIKRALMLFQKEEIELTGSSRTDAGVHALQNFFHFDLQHAPHTQFIYKANAILPPDIVIKNMWPMPPEAHCRFDALSRTYQYHITQTKDPFRQGSALYYPYKLDPVLLQEGAALIKARNNFYAFSKANSQVKTFECTIQRSEWTIDDSLLTYNIEANRFLRGMVRLITGTLLKLARGKITLRQIEQAFSNAERGNGFSVPAHGLFLTSVKFTSDYFQQPPA